MAAHRGLRRRPVGRARVRRAHIRNRRSFPKPEETTATPRPPETDTGLLARPAEAGHHPIEVLLAVRERDVRSALRRVLGRSQEEDDLVQEVSTRLVVRLRQPGELCVGAWLRGVANNLAVDEIRRRRPASRRAPPAARGVGLTCLTDRRVTAPVPADPNL